MTSCVLDASVAVEYLLRTPLGVTVAAMLESAALAAPSAPGIQRSRRPEGAGPAVAKGDRAMRAMYHNRPRGHAGRRGSRGG